MEYFTEISTNKLSEEEKMDRRKKYLVSDIMDIIKEKNILSDEEIEQRVEHALKLYFC